MKLPKLSKIKKEKIRNFFTTKSRLKISTKVILSFTILVLIQASVLLIAVTIIISSANINSLKNQMKQTLLGAEGYFDSILKDLVVKADLLAGQKKVIDYTDFGLRNLLEKELLIFNESLVIDSAAIFLSPDDLFIFTGEAIKTNQDIKNSLKLAFLDNKPYFISIEKNNINLFALSPIKRQDKIIGVLSLSIKMDNLFIKKLEKIINSTIIFVFQDRYVYSGELKNEVIKKVINTNDKKTFKENILKIDENIIGVIKMTSLGLREGRILCLFDTKDSKVIIQRYNIISVILTLLILTFAFLVSYAFYRFTFYHPFQELLRGIKKISEGNLNHPIKIIQEDELGELAKAFDQMRVDLINREKELSQLSRYNTLILENIRTGVLAIDLKNNITLFNPAAQKIIKFTKKHSLKKQLSLRNLPEDFFHIIMNSMKKPIYYKNKEVSVIKKKLENKIINLSTSPLLSMDGKQIGLIATFDDITREKKLEEQLAISSRLAALGEMIAGVAHQIRNPLGIIKVSSEMLHDNFKVIDNSNDYYKLTNMIITEIDTLNLVVRNFLDFAKPQTGDKTRCSIEEIIKMSLETIQYYKFPNIKIITSIKENIPKYEMDKILIEQTISNLVLNALQASYDNGKVEIRVFMKNKKLHIEIQDWGMGMDEETKKNIFNPFFTTKKSGTGLGLSIVHRILVENHNGTIDFTSTLGKGSTFRVIF